MNEAAFKFKTFSEKTRKQYGFWVRYPWRLIETEVKPTCRSGGSAVAKAHTTVPLDASCTWEWLELFPEALMILLSLYVLLFVSSLNSSIHFSVSGFPAPCDPENVVDPRTGSRSGVCPAVLMAVIAHEMDLKMGLFEISKLHDYWSLPGACWLEMLFDLLWSP